MKNRSAKLLVREHGTARTIESLISTKFVRDHFLSRIHGLSRGIFLPRLHGQDQLSAPQFTYSETSWLCLIIF